jgi:hypothetical protein
MYAWQSKLNTKSISEFSPNIQILLLKKYRVLKFFSKINSHLKNSHITVLKKTNIKSQWSNKTQLIKFCSNIPKCFLKNKFLFEKSSLNNNVLSKENKLNEWHNKTQSIKFMNSLLKKYHVSKFFSKINSHLKIFKQNGIQSSAIFL